MNSFVDVTRQNSKVDRTNIFTPCSFDLFDKISHSFDINFRTSWSKIGERSESEIKINHCRN